MADRISTLDDGYQTGDLSIFPQAIDDKRLLYEATNNAKTKLVHSVTYNSKIIFVDDTSSFPTNGQIRIYDDSGRSLEYELVAYELKTANSFQQLKRGFAGSKQNSWSPGTIYVTNAVGAEHENAPKDAVINIENDLGITVDPDPESLNGILMAQEVRFLSPKPLFRAYPTDGPPPMSVRFQNFTTGHIIRYLWDFGDGGTSLEKHPTHTYIAEGQYTVKLNVITSTGGQGIVTKTNYINVNADDSVPFFYVDSVSNPYSIQTAAQMTANSDPTSPKEFLFVDQSDGDIVQRNWIFGDGVQVTEDDPDIHTVKHTFALPGSYVVTLLVIFLNGRLKKIELPNSLVVL
jgi:PKD repeat protein